MELRLADRILLMKIRLALTTQKLNELGQQNFASYIYSNVAQLYMELDELKHENEAAAAEVRMNNVLQYLSEIENVLTACKVGIKLPLEDSTLDTVKDLKWEIKELIRRQQFAGKLAS